MLRDTTFRSCHHTDDGSPSCKKTNLKSARENGHLTCSTFGGVVTGGTEGCRVERDAPRRVRPPPHRTVRAVFPHTALRVEVCIHRSRSPNLSESFHFGHDGIVQLGQAVYGSPHHLRIAPFDRPFGQYISHPHVLCLPFSRRGPSLHGHYPLPRYYGLIRLLVSLSLLRGLPSSLAELSGHATLLCPAALQLPKSIR